MLCLDDVKKILSAAKNTEIFFLDLNITLIIYDTDEKITFQKYHSVCLSVKRVIPSFSHESMAPCCCCYDDPSSTCTSEFGCVAFSLMGKEAFSVFTCGTCVQLRML